MIIQKGDANGNQNKGRKRTQHNTTLAEKPFNGAHHGAGALVEI
jgi:hypothetical protein